MINFSEAAENLEHRTAGGTVKLRPAAMKRYRTASKTWKTDYCKPSNSISGYISKREGSVSKRYLHTSIQAAPSQQARGERNQVSTDGWTSKQNVGETRAVQYYSALGRKSCHMLQYGRTWGHYAKWNKGQIMYHSAYRAQSSQAHRDRMWSGSYLELGVGRGITVHGYRVLYLQMKSSRRAVNTLMWIYLIPELNT